MPYQHKLEKFNTRYPNTLPKVEARLDDLSRDGWELISVSPGEGAFSDYVTCWFRKEVP